MRLCRPAAYLTIFCLNGLGVTIALVNVILDNRLVEIGQFASFRCEVTDSLTITKWTKGSTQLVENIRTHFFFNNASLVIFNTTLADGGEYFCHAMSTNGTTEYGSATLVIIGPLFVEGHDATAKLGQDVALTCTGLDSFSKITWSFQGQLVYDNDHYIHQDNSLIVLSATPQDAGNYTCEVTNGQDPPDRVFAHPYLFVESAPVIVYHTKHMSIRLGQKANFECIVDGTPIPSVSWQHSGRNLDFTSGHYKVENNGRLHTLTIDAVLERNAGSYMCMASNEYGFVLSTPATLNVEDNTDTCIGNNTLKTAHERESVTLCCNNNKQGYPPIWKKDGIIIDNTTNRVFLTKTWELLLIKVRYEDRGTYTCNGHTKHTTVLTVEGVPPPTPIVMEATIMETNPPMVFVRWFVPVFITHWPITKFKVSCRYLPNQQGGRSITFTSPSFLSTTVDCLKGATSNTMWVLVTVTAVNDVHETLSQPTYFVYKHRHTTSLTPSKEPANVLESTTNVPSRGLSTSRRATQGSQGSLTTGTSASHETAASTTSTTSTGTTAATSSLCKDKDNSANIGLGLGIGIPVGILVIVLSITILVMCVRRLHKDNSAGVHESDETKRNVAVLSCRNLQYDNEEGVQRNVTSTFTNTQQQSEEFLYQELSPPPTPPPPRRHINHQTSTYSNILSGNSDQYENMIKTFPSGYDAERPKIGQETNKRGLEQSERELSSDERPQAILSRTLSTMYEKIGSKDECEGFVALQDNVPQVRLLDTQKRKASREITDIAFC